MNAQTTDSKTATAEASNVVVNVPNALTAARLVLAIVMFGFQSVEMHFAALVLFIFAASTDWVDGFYARRYGQVTKLGRVFDPFVDKVLICGVFIFLSTEYPKSGIHASLAVLIFSREMLVTALRSSIEQSGGDFSAKWSGKWKMVFQCVAVIMSLLVLCDYEFPEWYSWALSAAVWLAVISTVYSGVEYIFAATKYFRA